MHRVDDQAARPWIDGSFRTSDGVTLHYLEAGSGKPVILIPGWSQTAEQWKFQIESLSAACHVIAVDMRGHGLSEKPAHGYRISRLAADLHDLIRSQDLRNVVLIGHSMGSSVIWSYLEQYGDADIERMVFVDQASAIVGEPGWSEEERLNAGAILSAQEAAELVARLAQDDGSLSASFVRSMFSDHYPADHLDWVLAQNALLPRAYAARLLYDHAFKNWQDVIGRIRRPCLCVGAERSIVPWQAMLASGRAIAGAKTVIFKKEEGGSHFMFLENPIKFNQVLADFLSDYANS